MRATWLAAALRALGLAAAALALCLAPAGERAGAGPKAPPEMLDRAAWFNLQGNDQTTFRVYGAVPPGGGTPDEPVVIVEIDPATGEYTGRAFARRAVPESEKVSSETRWVWSAVPLQCVSRTGRFKVTPPVGSDKPSEVSVGNCPIKPVSSADLDMVCELVNPNRSLAIKVRVGQTGSPREEGALAPRERGVWASMGPLKKTDHARVFGFDFHSAVTAVGEDMASLVPADSLPGGKQCVRSSVENTCFDFWVPGFAAETGYLSGYVTLPVRTNCTFSLDSACHPGCDYVVGTGDQCWNFVCSGPAVYLRPTWPQGTPGPIEWREEPGHAYRREQVCVWAPWFDADGNAWIWVDYPADVAIDITAVAYGVCGDAVTKTVVFSGSFSSAGGYWLGSAAPILQFYEEQKGACIIQTDVNVTRWDVRLPGPVLGRYDRMREYWFGYAPADLDHAYPGAPGSSQGTVRLCPGRTARFPTTAPLIGFKVNGLACRLSYEGQCWDSGSGLGYPL